MYGRPPREKRRRSAARPSAGMYPASLRGAWRPQALMVSADRCPDRSAGSDTLLPFGFGRPRLPSFAITSSYPSQGLASFGSLPSGSFGRCRRTVRLITDQHRPGDRRRLVGDRHGGNVGQPLLEQTADPSGTVHRTCPPPAQGGPRAVDQEPPKIGVAAVADSA